MLGYVPCMANGDSDGPRKPRRGYHHGNLREALVSAARRLIAEKGAAGFAFSDAAKAAGVSPAAPYRHFKDRDDLLAEVARQGFEDLADRLEAAFEAGGPSPMRAFDAVTAAYLAFAREERPAYLAMFQPGVSTTPDVARASERAFAVLRRACEGLVRHLPPAERPPLHMMAYHLWALAHGTTELFGTENSRRAPIPAEDLLEAAALIYLRGLGLVPDS
ncbi:MAG: TetR/AcrR family transcriptional regulator [Pseudomonadota bacterium]